MMNPTEKAPHNPTTDNQQSAPDIFDRFAAWAKPKLNRLIDNAIEDPRPYLNFFRAEMDNRRTHRNVRRVIEQSQEIELQTSSLHMRTAVPGRYPGRAPQRLDQGTVERRGLPRGEGEKRS